MNNNHKSAFAIIEVLIVICIATILIAGIYFAKQMLRDNDVKSLIMQIKKYDAAVNLFTEKYHALPGDVRGTVTYGITENSTDGNGDNIVTDNAHAILSANGEITNFWMHLSKTKMIDENYDGAEDEKAKLGSTFPNSKLGEKIGIIAFGAEGKTFYQIGFDSSGLDRILTKNRALKPTEAFLFDKKIDDGNPKKGRVVAAGGNMLNILENDECAKFNEYIQESISPSCQLRIEVK